MLCVEASRLLVLAHCQKVIQPNYPGRPQCAVVAGQSSARAKLNAPFAERPTRFSLHHSRVNRPADQETIRFARAVLNRPYKFTIVLLIANLFVFLLMWQSSG